jgi:hypothetical protein
MNRLNQYRHDAFVRALQYKADHPLETPIARATELFTELGGIATAMNAHNASQAIGRMGFRAGADERRQLFASVVGDLQVINRIARGLDAAQFPAVAEEFRMPKSRSYANIAASGRAFVANAAGREAIFTDRGVLTAFFTAFAAKVTAAEAAVAARNTGLINRAGATAGITANGRRGVAILRELDGIISAAARNDPALLAAWRTAKRIARKAPAEEPAGSGADGSTTPPAGS